MQSRLQSFLAALICRYSLAALMSVATILPIIERFFRLLNIFKKSLSRQTDDLFMDFSLRGQMFYAVSPF